MTGHRIPLPRVPVAIVVLAGVALFVAACAGSSSAVDDDGDAPDSTRNGSPDPPAGPLGAGERSPGDADDDELRIVTLLPRDAIPAILDPQFVSADEADERFFGADDLVLGVEIDGDARAYGTAFLSRHEIVNDVVGGRPIAATW